MCLALCLVQTCSDFDSVLKCLAELSVVERLIHNKRSLEDKDIAQSFPSFLNSTPRVLHVACLRRQWRKLIKYLHLDEKTPEK